MPALAIDRLRIDAEEFTFAGITSQGVRAELAIASARRSVLTVSIGEVERTDRGARAGPGA